MAVDKETGIGVARGVVLPVPYQGHARFTRPAWPILLSVAAWIVIGLAVLGILQIWAWID